MNKIKSKYTLQAEEYNCLIEEMGIVKFSSVIQGTIAEQFLKQCIDQNLLYLKREDKDDTVTYSSTICIIDEMSLFTLNSLITKYMDVIDGVDYLKMKKILGDL